MNNLMNDVYSEVDAILNLMDKENIQKIPQKLRDLFRENKSKDYKVVLTNKPLEEQNLKEETFNILAALYYNYWCKDENEKKELLKTFSENERKYQDELRKKYNPDNIFEKQRNTLNRNINQVDAQMPMIENKGSIFTRIKRWFKNIINKF